MGMRDRSRLIVGERPRRGWRENSVLVLRIAPWLLFGPITGLLTERALRCYRAGDPVLATLYIVLNISILVAIPSLTAALAM